MRFSTPVLLCQFGWLVLGQDIHSITEIDLLAPIANVTYGMSHTHRFPIVWSLQNPSLWQAPVQIDWRLENVTSGTSTPGAQVGNVTFSSKLANDAGVQFATLDTLLIDVGTYRLTWSVHNQPDKCDETSIEKHVDFSTNNGGEGTNLFAAANHACNNRSTIVYNITTDECHRFEDTDGAQLSHVLSCYVGLDNTALDSIQNSLDVQYNKTCANPQASVLCPQSSKNSAYKLGVEAWFMGFLLMVFFL